MELQAIIDRLDSDHIVSHITIPPEDTNTLIDQFTIALAYQHNIKPAHENESLDDAVRERIGEDEYRFYLETTIMGYAFPFAMQAQQLYTIGKPHLTPCSPLTRNAAFSFDAESVLKPSFLLSSYDPVEITVPPLEVTESDVANYLEALAQKNAYLEEDPSRSEIHTGDLVELEIETFRDGERCDQLCSESKTYTTGAQLMPEEFDDQVMQMRVGETRTIEYSCPGIMLDENNQPEPEHYVSTVTAKKVQKTIVPELTDEWIKENMPEFDSFESLQEHVRATITERKTTEYRHYKNLQSAQELEKRFTGTISDAVCQAVVEDIAHSFEEQLIQQGTTKEEFMRQQGITDQQITAHFTQQVNEQLARQFALDAIAEHFDLEVTDEDLDEYFRAAASPGLEAMVRLDFERNGRMHEAHLSALRLKANDYVTEHALIHIQK